MLAVFHSLCSFFGMLFLNFLFAFLVGKQHECFTHDFKHQGLMNSFRALCSIKTYRNKLNGKLTCSPHYDSQINHM
jgi:hypothetical protein